jgi:hypothetical protein
MSTELRKVAPNHPDDRHYTYTWKGNCVPFGHGVHPNEEVAMAEAKRTVSNLPGDTGENPDWDKEIILTVIR